MKYYVIYLPTTTHHSTQKHKSQIGKVKIKRFQYSFLFSHYATVEQGSVYYLIYIAHKSLL